MKVKPFNVGPIVGATTPDTTRIFGAGDFELDHGRPRQAHAVVRMRLKGSRNFDPPQYTKLNPNFDMTGVSVFSGLKPDSIYEYEAGQLFSRVDSNHLDVSAVLDWSEIETESFRSGSSSNAEPRNLIVGSCRYLLRLFGGSWLDDRGDKTFRSIRRRLGKQRNIHGLLMVGDQIYADDLNLFRPDDAINEFYSRYRSVFSQEHIRSVMASIPTYMTLDDHEIEDNWPEQSTVKDYVTKFPAAIHAYQTYQLSHSPLYPLENGRISSPPDRLWYTHSDGCCDFFFSDARTERNLSAENREMLSASQLAALLDWLGDASGRVKVLATPVPFWESTSEDKWNGFLDQRDAILEHIRSEGIQKTLIVSGGVHASMSSELRLAGDPNFKIVSIVSSAFFWPYPHPLKRSFHLSGSIDTNSGRNYRVQNASKVQSTDNFTALRISPDRVRVESFGRKGDALGTKTHRF